MGRVCVADFQTKSPLDLRRGAAAIRSVTKPPPPPSPSPRPGWNTPTLLLHTVICFWRYIADSSLPAVTSVSALNLRFANIWQLGILPCRSSWRFPIILTHLKIYELTRFNLKLHYIIEVNVYSFLITRL